MASDKEYEYSDFESEGEKGSRPASPAASAAGATGAQRVQPTPPPASASKRTRKARRRAPVAAAATTSAALPPVVPRRPLSANGMANQLAERERELHDLRRENKLLQQIQRRQEAALQKFEGDNSDVGGALKRKDEEIRVLREQLRLLKEKHAATQGEQKKVATQLADATRTVEELTRLVEDKKLKERAVLDAKLEKLQTRLNEREEHIARLEKKAALEEKERKREWKRPQEETNMIASMQAELDQLRTRLEQKEKQLQKTNLALSVRDIKPVARQPPAGASPTRQTPEPTTAAAPATSPRKRMPTLPAIADRQAAKAAAAAAAAAEEEAARRRRRREEEEEAAAAAARERRLKREAEEEEEAERRRRRIQQELDEAEAITRQRRLKQLQQQEEEEAEQLRQRQAAARARAEEEEAMARRRALEEEAATAAAARRRAEEEEAAAAAAARRRAEEEAAAEAAARRRAEQESAAAAAAAAARQRLEAEEAAAAARQRLEAEEATARKRMEQLLEQQRAETERLRLAAEQAEEQRKKAELLARMRAIDSKTPPAPAPAPEPAAWKPAELPVAAPAPAPPSSTPASARRADPMAWLNAKPAGSAGAAREPQAVGSAFENLHKGLPADGRRVSSGRSAELDFITATGNSNGSATRNASGRRAAAVAPAPEEPTRADSGKKMSLKPELIPPIKHSNTAEPIRLEADAASLQPPSSPAPQQPRRRALPGPEKEMEDRLPAAAAPAALNATQTISSIPPMASGDVPAIVSLDEPDVMAGNMLADAAVGKVVSPRSSTSLPWETKVSVSRQPASSAEPEAVPAELPTFKRASRARGRVSPGGASLPGMQGAKRPRRQLGATGPAEPEDDGLEAIAI